MKSCAGTPAELCALPYIEGTLPERQMELFEAHYFECPVCLAYLEDLQAVSAALARIPADKGAKPARKGLLTLPSKTWALGAAAAALLLAAIFSFRALYPGPRPSPIARTAAPQPASPPSTPSPPAVSSHSPRRSSQLADLALPPFVAPHLRGAQGDVQFESGMRDYEKGDCRNAAGELAKVSAQSEDARAARFYCAACEMRLGHLPEAAAGMREVASAGDSPQQESALYYEAQIALAMNNPAAAHRYLMQTIALEGDLQQRAREEDREVRQLLNEPPDESAEKPEILAR